MDRSHHTLHLTSLEEITAGAGTGTVMGPHTLQRYANEASFTEVEILPIENDLWRFLPTVLLAAP